VPETEVAHHPYMKVLAPIDGKIIIERTRELAAFVQLQVPGDAKIARIICIEDAETMTREAQNALLKFLEEPPARTCIILTSSQPRKLLSTITSRLQKITISTPEESELVAAFTAKGYDEETVRKAHMMSNGSVAELVRMLEGEEAGQGMLELTKRILAGQVFERLSVIDIELKDKDVARQFVDTLTLVASSSLQRNAQPRWYTILQASTVAQKALAQNGNQKLVLTELMLSL
jgi:DNA polymerase-3 subunit delta'